MTRELQHQEHYLNNVLCANEKKIERKRWGSKVNTEYIAIQHQGQLQLFRRLVDKVMQEKKKKKRVMMTNPNYYKFYLTRSEKESEGANPYIATNNNYYHHHTNNKSQTS